MLHKTYIQNQLVGFGQILKKVQPSQSKWKKVQTTFEKVVAGWRNQHVPGANLYSLGP
jgi:hypothetical protein